MQAQCPKTLITGGAGFIGSHLAERLHRDGHALVLVDDLSTGCRSNIEHLLDPAGERGVLVQQPLERALRDQTNLLDGVTEIYHLAASVGVQLVADDPVSMIRNNVEQTSALLAAAAGREIRFFLASSSEVYGCNDRMPLKEDDELIYGTTTRRRFSYGLSKALDEHLVLSGHDRGQLSGVVVRLFNTIGLRQVGRWGMVVPRFVRAAVSGRDLTIYGDGAQTRCFCDVRDVVRALVDLMAQPSCHGQVFNVGSDHEIDINALADRVISLSGARVGKVYAPFDKAFSSQFEDIYRRVPDVSKLKKAIGFVPKYTLDQTLAELIEMARSEG